MKFTVTILDVEMISVSRNTAKLNLRNLSLMKELNNGIRYLMI